ncbi:forkhead domain-containing protein [Pochonia chlamydosporia 170]|uniref:Forkhead domain-containing protein n=1 Tax=Pochonia chlamydosporia 170 TaxID=1380566 RepID=A0A179G2H6_METCM|nr:forkhead domain-containing protein [Pochonia chlamydosporia 170]OAQ72065.1 forkhead domain-containing protein [Pochonia chlamydosporia 170]
MTSSSDGRNGPEHQQDADASMSTPASAELATVTPVPASATNEPATTSTAATVTSGMPATADSTSQNPPTDATATSAQQQAEEPVPVPPSTPKRNGDATNTLAQQPTSASALETPVKSSNTTAAAQAVPEMPKDSDGDTAMTGQTQTQPELSQQQIQKPQPPNVASVATSEQFPPSTPFTPAQMANLDQHAYMMMALASMSGAQNAMSPPPTVTPSQVTLPNMLDDGMNGTASTNALRQGTTEKGLESFARIEFADSVFQMTTYAVIIGRDQRALEQARRDEKRADEHQRRVEENASKGLPPPSPIRHDRSKFSKSYVSEEGGMLGPESDSEGSGRPPKRRKTSTNGSSQQEVEESQENVISNRQYVSHTPGAAAVDLSSLRPSPYHVPFIGIHSPGPNIAGKTKAISREHLKIAYNKEEGVFEAYPLHKNGFFCEDVHYKSDKVVLKCGDRLQIKDVDFRFIINGVEKGRTGAEEYLEEEPVPKKRQSHGGKEMSFDFEQSHGNGEVQDTSDELSDVEISPQAISDGEDEEEDEVEGEEGDEGEEGEEGDGDDQGDDSELKNESTADLDLSVPQIPKKRGPGRPPKNGIMSKREQRLLKKQQQEMAKKTLPQAPPVEPPIKRKVGRPRKHPLPENAGDRPEKRKYKPRKPKEEGGEGSDAERRAREKKEKKARPKSPPLELKIEDYTDEQLQKPNKNYGVLIDETLTAAGPDGLTLKQIYKRICQRYPWFYFHTETKGWESSVRHNLIGNEAFKKDETTNLWSRVPGVELDAGKKRKATSPDRGLAAQGYGPYSYPYNAAQHMPPGAAAGYPPGQAPPGYPALGYQGQPGQVPRPMQPYAPAPAHAGQPTAPAPAAAAAAAQPVAPTQLPGYGPPPAPARAQPGVPQPGTYSSPYASRPPPPPSSAPVKTEPGTAHPGATAPAPVQPPPQVAQAAASRIGAKTVPGSAGSPQTSTPGSRPSATPPTTAPPRPVIEPRLLSAVVGLKDGLVDNLKKARNPKAEAIVMSALNRCVGLKKEATENDKMESICIKGIRQVIEGFTKNKSLAPGGSASTETPPIFEPRVLASLNGFKDVSIKALKVRLGEARAEAITLSAIDRVLGFANASIVPQPSEGDSASTPTGNLQGVEQHLISSIQQLLKGMNQKLKDD